jgi:electron transfer flavoprotein alpha subunit
MSLLRTGACSTTKFAPRSSASRPSISAFHQQQQQRTQSTLVVAEPTDGSTLSPSTLSAITAASKLHSGPISLLTFSSGTLGVPSSVSSVIQANANGNSSLLAETITNAVVAANKKYGYSHIVASATKSGANYLGRAGAQLGVSPISDVVEILSEGKWELTSNLLTHCKY